MVEALVGAYAQARGAKYGFSGRDARAVTDVIALSAGDLAEAVRRFLNGLAVEKYPRCDTIADLARHWNAYAAAPKGTHKAFVEASPASAFEGVKPEDFFR